MSESSQQLTPQEAQAKETLLKRGEVASKIAQSKDAVCDGQQIRFGYLEYDQSGKAITDQSVKQQRTDDLLNAINSSKALGRDITAKEITDLSSTVAMLSDPKDGSYAGLYINCIGIGQQEEASAVVMIALVDYISQNQGKPNAEVVKGGYTYAKKALDAYQKAKGVAPSEKLGLAMAIVDKNGEMTSINTGGNDIAVLTEDGKVKDAVVKPKMQGDVPDVQTAKMQAGESVVMCGEGKAVALAQKIEQDGKKYTVTDMVDFLSADEVIEPPEALKGPIKENVIYRRKARIFTDSHGGNENDISLQKKSGMKAEPLDAFLTNLDKDELVVHGGDVPDRGEHSWEAIQQIKGMVERGEAVWNIGNHELLQMAAMAGDKEAFLTWFINGGDRTIEGAGVNLDAYNKEFQRMRGNVEQVNIPARQQLENNLRAQNTPQEQIDRALRNFNRDLDAQVRALIVQGAYRAPTGDLAKMMDAVFADVQQNQNLQQLETFLYDQLKTYTVINNVLMTHAGFLVTDDGTLREVPIDKTLLSADNQGKNLVGLDGLDVIQDELRRGNKQLVVALSKMQDEDNPFWVRDSFQQVIEDPQKGHHVRAQLNEQANKRGTQVEVCVFGHTPDVGDKVKATQSANPRFLFADKGYVESGERRAVKLIVRDPDPQIPNDTPKVVVIYEDPLERKRIPGTIDHQYDIDRVVEKPVAKVVPGQPSAAGGTEAAEAAASATPPPVEPPRPGEGKDQKKPGKPDKEKKPPSAPGKEKPQPPPQGEPGKEKQPLHKYPYFEDLPTGEPLAGIEAKLIRVKTIRDPNSPGGVRTVEINFLQEVDKLVTQARATDTALQNMSDEQILDVLESRVRYPGDYKDPSVKDAVYEMTKKLPDQEVLLMAIEAKRAMLLQKDNERMSADQLHRREVQTGVRHDTITAEIDGTFDKYFDQDGPKEIPQDDLTAFTFIADALMDVPDQSLGTGSDGKARTYREVFKELLADAKTNPESNRELLKLRRDFYKNALDALRSRELPVSEAKTPQEQVQMEMRILIQTLQHQIATGTSIEELRKQYKGVLSGASERTIKKIDEVLRKYPQVALDMALKGGDLMDRRSRYEGPPKLHEVPKEIKHKRLVQGPTTLEEAAEGKGIPPKKTPPPAPPPVEPSSGGTGPRQPPPAPPGGRQPGPDDGEPQDENDEGQPGGTRRPPPAPPPGSKPVPGQEPQPPPQPLPTEVTFGVVAAKQRIEHKDAQGKTVQEMEVLEERRREMARMKMTEDRKKWGEKHAWIKQLLPRFWKFTFGDTSTYAKEGSHGLKMLAEAGIQITNLPYDFQKDVDLLARENIRGSRRGVLQRFGGFISDAAHELSFTEKDLHEERIRLVKMLRAAVEDPANNQAFIQELQNRGQAGLLMKFSDILNGDFAAGEGLARRINTEFGDQLIHQAVGEMMEAGLTFSGPKGQPVEQFFKDKVILRILQAGLANGGVVPDEVYKQVNREMQDYFISREFIAWRDSLPPTVQAKFKESLTTVTDIAGLTRDILLPQLKQAQENEKSAVNVENYVKNLILKINLGTLESGQKGVINEGILERAAARGITNARVHELFEQARQSSGPQYLPPTAQTQRYMDAAVRRKNVLVSSVARLGTNNVLLGFGTGIGLFAARATIGGVGRLAVPIIGGSAVGGVFRAIQERRLFTREYEQHGVEKELNYQFPQDAKRRNEMQHLELHLRHMQSELTDPMNELVEKLIQATATEGEIMQLMGLIADTEARMEFADIRGEKGLFAANQPQSYQVEKTNLEVAKAVARAALHASLGGNATVLTSLQTQLGITVPAGQDAVDYILTQLTQIQADNLQTGTQATAQQQLALGGLTIGQAQSVNARESAFTWARRKRMAGAFATTMLAGGASAILSEAASAGIHGAIEAASSWNVPQINSALSAVGLLRQEVPAGSPVIIDHMKLDLPRSFTINNIDTVNHTINVTDGQGNALVMHYIDDPITGGHITKVVGAHGPIDIIENKAGVAAENPLSVPPGTPLQEVAGIKFNLPPGYTATSVLGGKGIDISDGHAVHHFTLGLDANNKPMLVPADPNETFVPHFTETPGGSVSASQMEQIWKDPNIEKVPPHVHYYTNFTKELTGGPDKSDYQELEFYNYVFQNKGTGNYGIVMDGSQMDKTIDYINPDGTPHFVKVNDLIDNSPLHKLQLAFKLGGHKGSFIVDANDGPYKFIMDPDSTSPLMSNGAPVILKDDIVLPDGTVLFPKGHQLTVGEFSRWVLNQDKIKENVIDLKLHPGDSPFNAGSYQTEYLNNYVPGSKAVEALNLAVGGKNGYMSSVITDADGTVRYFNTLTGAHEAGGEGMISKFDFGIKTPINEVDISVRTVADIYVPILIPLARKPMEEAEGERGPIPPLVPPSTPPRVPPIKPPEYPDYGDEDKDEGYEQGQVPKETKKPGKKKDGDKSEGQDEYGEAGQGGYDRSSNSDKNQGGNQPSAKPSSDGKANGGTKPPTIIPPKKKDEKDENEANSDGYQPNSGNLTDKGKQAESTDDNKGTKDNEGDDSGAKPYNGTPKEDNYTQAEANQDIFIPEEADEEMKFPRFKSEEERKNAELKTPQELIEQRIQAQQIYLETLRNKYVTANQDPKVQTALADLNGGTKGYAKELEEVNASLPPMNKNIKLSVVIPAYNESRKILKTLNNWTNQLNVVDGKPINPQEVEIIILVNRPNTSRSFDDTADQIEKFKQEHPDFAGSIHVLRKTFNFQNQQVERNGQTVEVPDVKMGTIYRYGADLALLRNLNRADIDRLRVANHLIRTGGADVSGRSPFHIARVFAFFDQYPQLEQYVSLSDYHPDIYKKLPLLYLVRKLSDGMNEFLTKGRSHIGLGTYRAGIYAEAGGFDFGVKIAEEVNLSRRMRRVMKNREGGVEAVRKRELVLNALDDPRRDIATLFADKEITRAYDDYEINDAVRKIELNEVLTNDVPPGAQLNAENAQKQVSAIFRLYFIRFYEPKNNVGLREAFELTKQHLITLSPKVGIILDTVGYTGNLDEDTANNFAPRDVLEKVNIDMRVVGEEQMQTLIEDEFKKRGGNWSKQVTL